MAEIKSTMDLVLERAAKMAAGAAPVSTDEEQEKQGMRLAAEYLSDQLPDLKAALKNSKPEARKAIERGAIRTLLRNIVLPRDEMLRESSEKALRGLLTVAGLLGVNSISGLCKELGQILQQYNQHREQVIGQLEDALLGQLEQQARARGIDSASLRASMHPQYQEEMAKMNEDLNDQYNQAMDQRKESIRHQLGLS